MDGMKDQVCYGGLELSTVSSNKNGKEEQTQRSKTYRLGSSNIFGTTDVNDFWTELFAGYGACRRKLGETVAIL